uniref:C2 domain-containing protein n=1 Tax=Pygocentrus nattereri TaxID=42514 RepID=A0AAR2J331_PYGNA
METLQEKEKTRITFSVSQWNQTSYQVIFGLLFWSVCQEIHTEYKDQDRRLRHLRSIAARNIVNRNDSPLLDTYFTLHLCVGDRISRDFYKSEVIRDSLNPTWRSLDFAMLPDLLDTSVSCFVVRIWGGRGEQYQLLIEWKVNLDGLRYTGQQIRSRNPNEIIFGLNDGYYAADFDQKDNSERKKNSLLQVDQSSVRNSYSVFSLLRLHTAQRAIKQTQVTVQRIGKEIEEKLRTTAACTERKKERECMQLRIGVLRSELERQRKALVREMDTLQKERVQLQRKEEAFSSNHQKLQAERDTLAVLHKDCTAKREQFLKLNAQLTFRCRQLLSELSYIYPIDVNSQSDYVICGVKLPNSEDFQAKDDGSVAVALGYTAHLVLMISCFLHIPLRYPLIQKGSRSSVRDTITDKLSEKERDPPRTSDRHHVSSSIPVPMKSQLNVSAASEITFPASPDRGTRERASSEADKQKYKEMQTPPPSYRTAMAQRDPITVPEVLPDPPGLLSSSLDASIDLAKTLDADGKVKVEEAAGLQNEAADADAEVEKDLEEKPGEETKPPDDLPVGCPLEEPSTSQLPGTMNGSAVPGNGVNVGIAAVEQAEEIMGTEATGLGLGARLEDFPCIPVEHAVAVESDDQVLGELDAAGFEEFSRRIYALNENMSSFRRPRKNSDK